MGLLTGLGTLGFGAATTGAGAAVATGLSLYSAGQQNQAISAAQRSQAESAAIGQRQLQQAAGQQQAQRVDEARVLTARIRVARGEAGVGLGGSTAAVTRQADFDAAEDLLTINMNALMGVQGIRSGSQAQIAQLGAQTANPLVAAFLGALQGGQAGLQIAGGINRARPASARREIPV